jgi:formylglycine-generating enzyme required for sulfatase activity
MATQLSALRSRRARCPAAAAGTAALLGLLLIALAACSRHEKTTLDVATLGMKFVRIEPGTFAMGSDSRKSFDQGPVHQVTISRPFDLQITEVTQAQWTAVMGSNPSRFQSDALPVEQVSWNDAQEFIGKLNQRDPGKNYRLPTEAEWEYACRAGTTEATYGDLDAVAWNHGNSGDRTHPVGEKQPNAWGLYDMLGNVWELCSDWKGPYPSGAVTDPAGPSSGYFRVSRGGGWFDVRPAVSASFRSSPEPSYRGSSLGFRIVRDDSR